MDNIVFNRPSGESVGIDPFLHRDGQILMPSDLPIGLRRLVKENAPRQEWWRIKERPQQVSYATAVRDLVHFGHCLRQISYAVTVLAIVAMQELVNGDCETFDVIVRENFGCYGEAVVLNLMVDAWTVRGMAFSHRRRNSRK